MKTKFYVSVVGLCFAAVAALPNTVQANSYENALSLVYAQLLQAIATGDSVQINNAVAIFFEVLAFQDESFGNGSGSEQDEIDVTTDEDVDDITRDSAELRGEIDFDGDTDRAYVWFEYGEEEDELEYETSRMKIDDRDDEEFEMEIDDLDSGERYYFRAVAEDRDTDDLYYGNIEDFKTSGSSSNNDDEPDVDTEGVDDVDEDSAEISGSVDMNDFKNGFVFFAWGEDEDEVEDVRDEDDFEDVRERGDDLQKQRVDSDLDGDEDYELDIRGLDDDTEIFYTICVAYEDEDDDEVIDCGDVEEFETDRD